jgi:hypothetical protein
MDNLLDGLGETHWRLPKEQKGIMQALWATRPTEGEKHKIMVCWKGGTNLVVEGVTNRTSKFNPATTLPSLAISWVEKHENPDQVIREIMETPFFARLLQLEGQGHFDAVFTKKE